MEISNDHEKLLNFNNQRNTSWSGSKIQFITLVKLAKNFKVLRNDKVQTGVASLVEV